VLTGSSHPSSLASSLFSRHPSLQASYWDALQAYALQDALQDALQGVLQDALQGVLQACVLQDALQGVLQDALQGVQQALPQGVQQGVQQALPVQQVLLPLGRKGRKGRT